MCLIRLVYFASQLVDLFLVEHFRSLLTSRDPASLLAQNLVKFRRSLVERNIFLTAQFTQNGMLLIKHIHLFHLMLRHLHRCVLHIAAIFLCFLHLERHVKNALFVVDQAVVLEPNRLKERFLPIVDELLEFLPLNSELLVVIYHLAQFL